jgi:hypothetical protein
MAHRGAQNEIPVFAKGGGTEFARLRVSWESSLERSLFAAKQNDATGHRVNSRQPGASVAFGAKRILTEPRLQKRIYEYTR